MRTSVFKIVRRKPGIVFTQADRSVREAVDMMHQSNVGSILILDADSELKGIFTERDLLRRVVAAGLDPEKTRIDEVMTCDIVVVDGKADRGEVHRLMKEMNIRHIPVVEERKVLGIVSLRDILRAVNADMDFEITQLRGYVEDKPYPAYPG